jgi:hypothetical protein
MSTAQLTSLRRFHHSFKAVAVALLLGGAGCSAEVGVGVGAPEPDESDRTTFSNYPAGTEVEVCNTESGVNMRTKGSTAGTIVWVLPEGATGTVLASSGSWYKIEADGHQGWSYGKYLCATGDPSPTSPTTPTTPTGGCTGTFTNPIPGAVVSSEFGSCRDNCSRTHAGIDLAVPVGTSVHASDGGRVTYAGWMSGYGYTIDLEHCGRATRYGHLSQFLVDVGDTVSQGQVIAKSGNTGDSTGPHLHFEIRNGSSSGTPVNPRNFVQF